MCQVVYDTLLQICKTETALFPLWNDQHRHWRGLQLGEHVTEVWSCQDVLLPVLPAQEILP